MRHTYPDAIIGKQRRNSISQLKQSFDKDVKGIRFIIRFKYAVIMTDTEGPAIFLCFLYLG